MGFYRDIMEINGTYSQQLWGGGCVFLANSWHESETLGMRRKLKLDSLVLVSSVVIRVCLKMGYYDGPADFEVLLHKPDMIPIDYRGFLSTQRYACAAAMAGCQFHRGEGVHKIAHLFCHLNPPLIPLW